MLGTTPHDGKTSIRTNWPTIAEGRHIEALKLRDQWGVVQPELNTFPRWMRPRVTYAVKQGMLPKPFLPLCNGWHAMQHALNHLGGDWADHCGRIVQDDGTQLLISEPYQLLSDGHEQLEALCWTLGLTYRVDAQSWWFPGRTLRIVIQEANPNG